jgi:hypothetical protein
MPVYSECMQKRSSIPGDGQPDEAPAVGSASADVTDEEQRGSKAKNPAAVALGRLGGLKGGRARAAKLTPEQRSEVARRAAQARWSARSK